MDISSMLKNLKNLLNFKSTNSQSIPSTMRLLAAERPGLSVIKCYNEYIEIKKKLNIPIGTLPDGSVNPDDVLAYSMFEIIINALKNDAKIETAIQPLGKVTSVGTDAVGVPVTTQGYITDIQVGGTTIS